MQSRAAIGPHPLHPALVTLPIGAFFAAFVGDLAHLSTHDPFWYRFGFVALVIGLISALPAAIAGLIDYFGVDMGPAAARLATLHLFLNVGALVGDAVSVWLRWHQAALGNDRFLLAMGLSTAAFLTLGISGWIGGKMVFEHRLGVTEAAPAQAPRKTS